MNDTLVRARTQEILNMMCELAKGNLDTRLYSQTEQDLGNTELLETFDGIQVALNMLAEELQATVIRKEQHEVALAELEQAQLQLLHSSKLASLGELAAGVAHELNQPLQIISFATEEIRDALDPKGIEDCGRCLDTIEEQATRGADVVARLLAFSRRDDHCGVPRASLNEVVEEAVRMLRGQLIKQGVEVRMSLTPNLTDVACSSQELLQVITNLVINARDAVKNRSPCRISLRTTAEERSACLEVADTGRGIAESDLQRVFDPFFTTKPVGQGTGLGLSISHGIICRSGGTIEALSEIGSGTRMRVTVPVVEHDAR